MLTLRAIGPVSTAEPGAVFGGILVQDGVAHGVLLLQTTERGIPREPVVEAILGDTVTRCEVIGVAGGMDANGEARLVISWRALDGADTYQCSVPANR